MAARKKQAIPELKVRPNATLREIYAQIRKEFTAADLQRFTEIEEGVPANKLLTELEEIHRKALRKGAKGGRSRKRR